jgi:hypothetical protein
MKQGNYFIYRLAALVFCVAVLFSAGCTRDPYVVSGHVRDTAGKPVAGVVVSDGYTCVQTDDRGKYSLTRDSLAQFLFVSVPSGFEAVPQDGFGSIPAFWQPAFPVDGERLARYKADFALVPIDIDTKKFVLLAIGDPQSGNHEQSERFRTETVPDMRLTAESYGEDTYVIGLVLGDIIWHGNEDSHVEQKRNIGEIGFPCLTTPGNHDKDAIDWTGESYSKIFGPRWYSYNIGDVHIVSMDNIHTFSAKETGAKLTKIGFSDEQLEWLRRDLSFVPKERKVIMFYHAPERDASSHINHDEVLSLVSEYRDPVAMSGHTHYNQFFDTNGYGIDEYILATSCGYFWRSECQGDGVPNGYTVFEIDGTNITNAYFKGTGQPRDFQIRLYRGDAKFGGSRATYEYGLGRNAIVANVFFGGMGGDWKIEMLEDGKLSGEMEKMESSIPDYWAYGYHTGILSHSFTSAMASNHHQYSYTLKNPRAKVLVKATDPWGNVYTQERIWSPSDLDGIAPTK